LDNEGLYFSRRVLNRGADLRCNVRIKNMQKLKRGMEEVVTLMVVGTIRLGVCSEALFAEGRGLDFLIAVEGFSLKYSCVNSQ